MAKISTNRNVLFLSAYSVSESFITDFETGLKMIGNKTNFNGRTPTVKEFNRSTGKFTKVSKAQIIRWANANKRSLSKTGLAHILKSFK